LSVSRYAVFTLLLATCAFAGETALDRYVHQKDPSYQYKVVGAVHVAGYTTYVVELTSQTWRTPAELDRPVWKHWLTIVKPDRLASDTAFLVISGGNPKDSAPDHASPQDIEQAVLTQSVVAELQDVPNEPLGFKDDSHSYTEDSLIVHTWLKFMRTGDENWPIRLPMTKAVVRALDAIGEILGSSSGGGVKVDHFVLYGAAKHGWTAWTTAAVDPRVAAIIPAVDDQLNLEASLRHHFCVYGFWSPALRDYLDAGFLDLLGTPQSHRLMEIVDPYTYRDRLTLPKFIVNAVGDPNFTPDASRFYFDDLPGEKYLRYIPNTDHTLKNSDARESVIAFYQALLAGKPRPRLTWTFEPNGDIRVVTPDKPTSVKLWQATTKANRDFRLSSLGPAFRGTDLHDLNGGVYIGRVFKPEVGFTAYFVELTYPGIGKYPMKFTSGVRVSPDNEPFLPYQPKRPGKK
jgi:PhoPQ-activated pathogenicity-related protein